MQLNFRYIIGGLIIVLFISCKSKTDEPQPVEMPEDFITFYNQFHTDTNFQVEHIHFPLEGMPALSPDSDLQGFSFWWEREGWKMHKPFDSNGGTFNRSYSNFAGIITETISDDSGQFTMVRRFTKMDGKWTLIYYKQMGRG